MEKEKGAHAPFSEWIVQKKVKTILKVKLKKKSKEKKLKEVVLTCLKGRNLYKGLNNNCSKLKLH